MRLDWNHLERFRILNPGIGPDFCSEKGDKFGVFVIPRLDAFLRMIATDGDYKSAGLSEDYAWEHVSVSTTTRCPTWEEMSRVKDLFWTEEEIVLQLHVPKSNHVNFHPFTLHLWKPLNKEIPLPPSDTIGPKPGV